MGIYPDDKRSELMQQAHAFHATPFPPPQASPPVAVSPVTPPQNDIALTSPPLYPTSSTSSNIPMDSIPLHAGNETPASFLSSPLDMPSPPVGAPRARPHYPAPNYGAAPVRGIDPTAPPSTEPALPPPPMGGFRR